MITVNMKAINTALKAVKPSCARRPTLPVLSCALLKAEDGQMTVTTNNLEFSTKISVPADADGEFAYAIQLKDLEDTLKGTSGSAALSADEAGKITVKTPAFSRALASIGEEEFPPSRVPTNRLCTLDAATLIEGVSKVVHAASTEEVRPTMTTVRFQLDGMALTLTATDGFRIARTCISTVHTDAAEPTTLLIPALALKAFIKATQLLKVDQVTICTDSSDAVALVSGDGAVVVSTVNVPGRYPDADAIFPRTYKYTTVLPREEVKIAARALMNKDTANCIHLEFTPEGCTMRNVGAEASCPIEAPLNTGPFAIGINATFLEQAMSVLNTAKVRMSFNRENSPALFTDDIDHPVQVELVMPMHLS